MTSDERYLEVIRVFDTFHNKSGLTDLGEDVRLRLQKVWENARGRGGNLTPIRRTTTQSHCQTALSTISPYIPGQRQHISAFERFRTLYHEHVRIHRTTERTKPLTPDHPRSQPKTHGLHCLYFTRSRKAGFGKCAMENSFPYIRRKSYSSERLIASLFKNPKEVRNPRQLMMGLYWIASDMQDVELPLSFYDLFEKEELFGIWQSVNYRMYICNANAPVNQGAAPKSAKSLLKNIIESADRAIREGTPCATLRFGHDTNLIRLLALMQVEGCSNQTDPDRYYLAWQDFRVSPMGAN